MSFFPRNATAKNWALRWYPCTAGSTSAIASNSAVDWPATATGRFVKATALTTKFCGILQSPIVSTTAADTLCAVLVPIAGPESILTATASGANATSAGTGVRCDMSDETTVNAAASAVGRFVITKYLSASLVEGYFLNVQQTAAA